MNKRKVIILGAITTVVVIVLAIIALFAFGGGGKKSMDDTKSNSSSQASSSAASTGAVDLKIEDIKVGNGTEVKSGDTVSINYIGTLTDGTKFDSSYDRKVPFETKIGVGQVIKGWDKGVVGMKVGGKRKLTIPPSLGYGAQGAGSKVPPNATLIFEVELMGIK